MVLQYLDGFLQLLILLRSLFLVLFWSRAWLVFIGKCRFIIGICNHHARRHSGILNRLAVGRIIFGNGQDQRRTVRQLDYFLYRTIAKRLIADNVAATRSSSLRFCMPGVRLATRR